MRLIEYGTHQYADLTSGFLNEEERTVTCPLHLSVFKLEDGIPQNPPAELPLKTYDVKIEDNDVYVLNRQLKVYICYLLLERHTEKRS